MHVYACVLCGAQMEAEPYCVECDPCEPAPNWWELEEQRNALYAGLTAIRSLVSEQAEDPGLWAIAATAPEAYLQEHLRRLHRTIEEGRHPERPLPVWHGPCWTCLGSGWQLVGRTTVACGVCHGKGRLEASPSRKDDDS